MVDVRARQTKDENEIDREEARERMAKIRQNKCVLELDYQNVN